ncbi:MAG: hypothetical protein HY704_16975 [Gemmatimonadetes bacterium]|nr:hypothetical protein [Gemmatimonadota bacterium]
MANGASAEQPIETFDLAFNAPAVRVQFPAGWWGIVFVDAPNGIPGAALAAGGSEAFIETPYGPTPARPPAAILPGATLSGFVVESAYPPGYARTYVEGYAGVPFLPVDWSEPTNTPDDTMNAQRGWSLGPTRYTAITTDGNRRPAVDGFLAFMNLATGAELLDPAPIAIKFAINGETVYLSTFRAELNGVDVTASFFPGPPDGADRVALFRAGSSPLVLGKNVLITSISGLVPGTTRTAIDTDRIVFTIRQ